MAGEDVPRMFARTSRDADFDGAVADAAVVAEAWRAWRREVALADARRARRSLDVIGTHGDPRRDLAALRC